MNDVSAAGDGLPQGRVETTDPPAARPVPAHGGEAVTPAAGLDVSPVTVLGGPPDNAEAAAPVRRRPRVRAAGGRPEEPGAVPEKNGRRRRTGLAIATATGVVALAAAPFAMVSPQVRILGDSASSAAKERPTTEAKKQVKKPAAKKQPVLPVPAPVPSWQARHSSPPAPVRPPRVKLSPPQTPPADTSKPAEKPGQSDQQAKARPRTLIHRPATAAESPAANDLVVRPKKKAARTKPTTPAEHNDAAVHTDAAEITVKASSHKSTASRKTSQKTSEESSRAPGQTRTVHGTYVLHPGESITTNRMQLALGDDGDLVLRDQNGKAVWSSGTHASGTHAVFQADGNLVVYSSDQQTLWSSRTDGHDGAVLVLQADGNLTIRQGDTTLWDSGT